MKSKVGKPTKAKLFFTKSNSSKDRPLIWGLLIFFTFGLFLAFLTPRDINLNGTLIGEFCLMMSGIVPSIQKYVSVSSFPNVTTIFLSFMWLGSVCLVPVMFLSIKAENLFQMLQTDYWKSVLKVALISFLGMLFMLGFFLHFIFMPVDLAEILAPDALNNRGKVFVSAMSNSRLGLSVFGTLMVFGSVGFFCVFLRFLHVLLTLTIKFPFAFINLFRRK